MNAGDVVLAWFPFSRTEPEPFKKRPVLVLGAHGSPPDQAVFVMMITGNAKRFAKPGPGDIVVKQWQQAGPAAPSVLRTRRIWTAEWRDVATHIGTVDTALLEAARAEVRQLLT